MSKYGNMDKKYSKKQLEAIRDYKSAVQSEAAGQGYRSEAEGILNKVYRDFEPDPVQAAADQYLKNLASEEGEDFASDWDSDAVEKGIIDAFKAGYRVGHLED